jgi:hypothetical protein
LAAAQRVAQRPLQGIEIVAAQARHAGRVASARR